MAGLRRRGTLLPTHRLDSHTASEVMRLWNGIGAVVLAVGAAVLGYELYRWHVSATGSTPSATAPSHTWMSPSAGMPSQESASDPNAALLKQTQIPAALPEFSLPDENNKRRSI